MVRIPAGPSDMIYRQEILKDLLANEELCKDIRSVIDSVKVLQYYGNGAKRLHDRDNSLASLLEELRALKVYVEVVETLSDTLSSNDIKSEV